MNDQVANTEKNLTDLSIIFPIFLACLSLFALGWMDNARGPFFPLLLDETNSTASQGSLFFALTSFIAIISSAVSGIVLKKHGIKVLMLSGSFLMSLCPIGLAMYPSLNGALLTAFIFGCSFGFITVGQNVLVGTYAPEHLKRKLFALLHCFYALAALSAPLSVLFLKSQVSWNFILSGLILFTIPLFFLSLFLKEKEVSLEVKEKLKSIIPPSITDSSVLVWLAFLSFYVSSELMLATRLVVLLQDYGYSYTYASNGLSMFFTSMLFVRLLFFLVNVPFKEVNILKTCTFSAAVLFMCGYFIWPPALCFMGLFMGPVFPTVMEVLSKKWPESFDVLVARVITISSLFVVANHLLVGKGTDIYGVINTLYIVPVFLILSLLTLFFSKKAS